IAGAEGRCLSGCLPEIARKQALLPQGTCGEGDRCAPCTNPVDGTDTGVCGLSCDTGPTSPPVVFSKCCGGIGSCVPRAAVPADKAPRLAKDTCATDQDLLCAPDAFLGDTGPAACVMTGPLVPLLGTKLA